MNGTGNFITLWGYRKVLLPFYSRYCTSFYGVIFGIFDYICIVKNFGIIATVGIDQHGFYTIGADGIQSELESYIVTDGLGEHLSTFIKHTPVILKKLGLIVFSSFM